MCGPRVARVKDIHDGCYTQASLSGDDCIGLQNNCMPHIRRLQKSGEVGYTAAQTISDLGEKKGEKTFREAFQN